MKIAGSRVLVTGGAGFIGSNLVRRLLADDVGHVTVLDTARRSFPPNLPSDTGMKPWMKPWMTVVRDDLMGEAGLYAAFRDRPDLVFHLGAHFANQKSLEEPERNLLVNGLGTVRLLEYARRFDTKMTVFASSGCAMAGNSDDPMTEDDVTPLHFDTPYMVTKALGEMYFNMYHARYGLPMAICRYFNVYGPGELPGKYRNVIPNFVWSAMNGQPLTITGTGDETRDYTYVADIVNGTVLAAESDQSVGQTFHFASGGETPVKRIVEAIAAAMDKEPRVQYAPRRPWDTTTRRRASIDKARRVLGYEPVTPFAFGVDRTYRWMRQNEAAIREFLCRRE